MPGAVIQERAELNQLVPFDLGRVEPLRAVQRELGGPDLSQAGLRERRPAVPGVRTEAEERHGCRGCGLRSVRVHGRAGQ